MAGEHHAICAIELHCTREHQSLDIPTYLCQVLRILRVRHPRDVLLDDRTLIEFR